MRWTMVGSMLLAFWFPLAAEAEVINLWGEFAPDKPYLIIDHNEADYDGDRWWWRLGGYAHPELPEPLPKPRLWVLNIQGARLGDDLERFDYVDVNRWRHPTITGWEGWSVSHDGFSKLKESWPWEPWQREEEDLYMPQRFDLAYPYHKIGGEDDLLEARERFEVLLDMSFTRAPASGVGQWLSPAAFSVPEPSTLLMLLGLGLSVLLAFGWRRRGRAA